MAVKFTDYTHYPGSTDLFNPTDGSPTLLDRWKALAAAAPQSGPVSPWASVIQYLSQPGAVRALPGASVTASSGTPGVTQAATSTGTGQKTLNAFASAPFQAIRAERSPEVAGVTGPLFADWNTLRTDVQKNQEDFKKAYGEFLPKSREFATQEISALSRYFDGSINKDLADLRANLLQANRGLDMSAAGDFVRGRSQAQLAQGTGTGGALGFSSGQSRIDSGVAREFDRRALATDADQQRRDFEWQEAAKSAASNQRRAMELAQIQDVLFPQLQAAASFNSVAQAGTGIAPTALANTISGIMTPQGIVGNDFGQSQGLYMDDLRRQSQIQQFDAEMARAAQRDAVNYGLAQQNQTNINRDFNLKEYALTNPVKPGDVSYNTYNISNTPWLG